jgi:hypothetical protein
MPFLYYLNLKAQIAKVPQDPLSNTKPRKSDCGSKPSLLGCKKEEDEKNNQLGI